MITAWVSRSDTECRCYFTDEYTLFLWDLSATDNRIDEVKWCFRILKFLGAPSGFTVTWWRFPANRILKPFEFPTRAEVNGGWTYRGSSAVYIFREEEWDRVLIHECIHALNWDVMMEPNTRNCLEAELGTESELKDAIFEAATELNAEWFYCIIHSHDDDLYGRNWLKQREWQKKQAIYILARKPMIWKEDTSVFAYYVLKSILAEDMDNFLINWVSGTLQSEKWCFLWSVYKESYFKEASNFIHFNEKKISMRMTDPSILRVL